MIMGSCHIDWVTVRQCYDGTNPKDVTVVERDSLARPFEDNRRRIVDAFLAASRGGDFDALLAMLDPDVVLRADDAAVLAGASKEVRGAAVVAGTFSGRARFAQPALVNGAAGAVWAPGGQPRVVFGFTITRGKIVEIDLIADPDRLRHLDLAVLDH
jgi:RNA polymerase sigma-70 factor (ECF subfamily)